MTDFIDLSVEETWRCISPYVRVEKNFQQMARPIIKRTLKQAIKKLISKSRGDVGRSEEFVSSAYSGKWLARDSSRPIASGGEICTVWNDNRFVMNGAGLRKLTTLRLMRLIEKLKPESVLDVGCGNGERVLQLACRFPHIRFAAVDLTPGGIECAKATQQHDVLPPSLVEFSPEPLLDLTAHKRVTFICSSAKELPFEDGEFDLVYTSVSLEQMERIRPEVLREIYRVTGKYASFYEAFRDYNRSVVQRAYIYGESYFKGAIAELIDVGFKRTRVAGNFPQKIYMSDVHVLAEK